MRFLTFALMLLITMPAWTQDSPADPHCDRGISYAKKGDYDKAIKEYDEAIRLDPNYSEAFYDRGNAYSHKGDYDSAIKDYDAVIALKPDFAKAFSNRGLAYGKKAITPAL